MVIQPKPKPKPKPKHWGNGEVMSPKGSDIKKDYVTKIFVWKNLHSIEWTFLPKKTLSAT